MAELADAPDLGSGVLRRAGSSPVIRTTEKGTWSVLFSFCQSNWPSILLLLFKSFRFCQFFDLISTYPLLSHTFSEILWTPSILTLLQVIRSPQISLTPPILTFLQVTHSTKFRWLLQHLLFCKSHTVPNFVDSPGTYFSLSHPRAKFFQQHKSHSPAVSHSSAEQWLIHHKYRISADIFPPDTSRTA